ncbi:hypothetical protein B0H11DRAFT_2421483 [Mycena galericulata]|nr:hypothetical protein B0H11DRAFT_2421483 [Mycena galericulata]
MPLQQFLFKTLGGQGFDSLRRYNRAVVRQAGQSRSRGRRGVHQSTNSCPFFSFVEKESECESTSKPPSPGRAVSTAYQLMGTHVTILTDYTQRVYPHIKEEWYIKILQHQIVTKVVDKVTKTVVDKVTKTVVDKVTTKATAKATSTKKANEAKITTVVKGTTKATSKATPTKALTVLTSLPRKN